MPQLEVLRILPSRTALASLAEPPRPVRDPAIVAAAVQLIPISVTDNWQDHRDSTVRLSTLTALGPAACIATVIGFERDSTLRRTQGCEAGNSVLQLFAA